MVQSNEKGKQWVFANIMNFLSFHKEHAEHGEIANVTIRNYYKPLKLFLEINDLELLEKNWMGFTKGTQICRRPYTNNTGNSKTGGILLI